MSSGVGWKMKENNALALIVAYYLSKFSDLAYQNLGFRNYSDGHKQIGSLLNIKPSSVRNMRDEFDSIHENSRKGWLRELRKSRLSVVEKFQYHTEEELRDVISEILNNSNESIMSIAESFVLVPDTVDKKSVFILRAPTGRKAEEHFIDYHKVTGKPVSGFLEDCKGFRLWL